LADQGCPSATACLADDLEALTVHLRYPLKNRRVCYLACDRVLIDIANGHQGNPDRSLEALGRARKAALTVPYHSAAAAAIPGTHLVATLPAGLARTLATPGVTTVTLAPTKVEPIRCVMSWHPRPRRRPRPPLPPRPDHRQRVDRRSRRIYPVAK
ncbi:MAG: hypothetical protein IRZ04_20010, partial [Rhodospirillales bacterium]|nr:hypothetical protein [Rhodospirillales bacterium]